MSEKKCQSQVAEHYVNDLFELLQIKGSNQKLFDEFCKLLMRFSEQAVKEAWREIIFSCNLPNGQLAGTMPKLIVIEQILRSKSAGRFDEQHNQTKKEILSEGTFKKLWQIGLDYSEGKINKYELEKKVEELK